MPTKKIVYFFIALLVVSTITCSVSALSAVTVSLHGEGVTIDLIYPDEARPEESITHNVTITANTALTMNFTIVIYALVNSSWQEVRRQTLTDYDLPENGKFTSKLGFVLPQEANGALYCYLNVSTNVNNNYLSATLYTTLVSEPTFSEMRVLYDEMLANYTLLQEDYETLFNTYNETLANYTKLLDDYKTLQDEYNQTAAERDRWKGDYEDLSANYSSLNATYLALFSEHNQLTADYNSEVSNYDALYNDFRDRTTELGNLQTVYSALNDTYYSLQTEFNKLQIDSSTLNQTYNNLDTAFTELQKRFTDSESAVGMGNIVMFIFIVVVAALIAFIVYIKRKQENPYLVIRKETVRMKSDEET
jgi:predicted nuclease with TOPRIM domain